MLTHKGTVVLHTPRLVLRRFSTDDAQAVYDSYTSDENVAKYHNLSVHESAQDTVAMLKQWVSQYENLEYYHWIIEYKDDVVGEINLFNIANKQERCEIGYTVASEWWNYGIATEAVCAVIRFAFSEINFNKICAQHDTENIGSGRVMLKNGMKQEGLFREHNVRQDGTRSDAAFYAILKSEWVKCNATIVSTV